MSQALRFLGEARLRQILYKVPLLSHFIFHGNVVFCIHSIRICPLSQQVITGRIKFVTMAMTKMSGLNNMHHSIRYNKSVIKEERLQKFSQENSLIPLLWVLKSKPHRLHGIKNYPHRVWPLRRQLQIMKKKQKYIPLLILIGLYPSIISSMVSFRYHIFISTKLLFTKWFL